MAGVDGLRRAVASSRRQDPKLTERRMKALVFEPHASGHRLNYVAVVLEAIGSLCPSVVFGTTKAVLDSVEFAEALAPMQGFDVSAPVSGPLTSRQAAHFLLRLEREHQPDVTLIPTADGIAQWLGWNRLLRLGLGSRQPPRVMLLMRGHNYLRPSAAPNLALKRLLSAIGLRLSGARTLLALDDELFELLRKVPLKAEVVRIPEVPPAPVVIAREPARESLGISDQAFVVGFFGRRDKRKGFDLLINALRVTTDPSIHLLVMGKASDETTDLFQRFRSQPAWAHRITSYERFVSREELNQGMAACDVVALPYREQEGSSGILTEAAAAYRYVLAADGGWIARTIREHHLGAVTNPYSCSTFATAIQNAIATAHNLQHMDARRKFLAFNRLDNVLEVWRNAAMQATHVRSRVSPS
jgi:glycosyltransferase involved in cell wall biosynthesis